MKTNCVEFEGSAVIKLSGMCEGCMSADLTFDDSAIFYDGARHWAVSCEHYKACDRVRDHYEAILEEMSE